MDLKTYEYTSTFYKKARELGMPNVRIILSKNAHVKSNFVIPQTNDHMKPKGVWYAFGGAWIALANSVSRGGLSAYNYVYEIDVDINKMLVIKSGSDYKKLPDAFKTLLSVKYVDWKQVAKNYCGVEFPAPYNYDEINDMIPLDAPSGCIWNSDAITNIKLLGKKINNKWVFKQGEPEEETTNTLQDALPEDFDSQNWFV
jgi:hypothetical protein